MRSQVDHMRKFDKMVSRFEKLMKKEFKDQMEEISFHIEDDHEPYIYLEEEKSNL